MELHPADAALAAALTGPSSDESGDDGLLTIDELAEHSGLSVTVLEAVEREGLLVPVATGDQRRYAPSDVDVVRAGMQLLEAGLPLGELLDLARRTDESLRGVADHAVDVFLRFVRDPIRGTATSDDEATRRLLDAFERMLPAAGDLVGSHMRRLVVVAARTRLEQELSDETSSTP